MPPITSDELETFNPKKNPAFEYAESKQWLAYQEEKVVGRIAAIKHNLEFEEEGKIRFGWIDFIDDFEVSHQLIQTVERWATHLGAKVVHGPLGFNDFDFEGMLVEGFDSIATIATIYNHPYYENHLEKLGYEKAVDWLEYEYDFGKKFEMPQRLEKLVDYVKEKNGFQLVELKKKKELLLFFDNFFHTVNESYEGLYGFYKFTERESLRLKEKFFSFLSLKYLSGVVNKNGDIVAFAITVPSLSKAFQKANGRIFPFGLFHMLHALRTSKNVDCYLIGALPEYQKKGASLLVILDLLEKLMELKVETLRFNPTLESNTKLFNVWSSIYGSKFMEEDFLKRRRCYTKQL